MSGFGKLFGNLFSSLPAQATPTPMPTQGADAPGSSHGVPVRSQAPTLALAEKRYGAIVSGVWDNEGAWMSRFVVPPELSRSWFVFGDLRHPVRSIYCNKDIVAPLAMALKNVMDRGCAGELKTFDGCFEIRSVRGSTELSCHAYGLALDLNADTNPLAGVSSWSEKFVQCFTDAGFAWGGNFKDRKDPMHFSFAWE